MNAKRYGYRSWRTLGWMRELDWPSYKSQRRYLTPEQRQEIARFKSFQGAKKRRTKKNRKRERA